MWKGGGTGSAYFVGGNGGSLRSPSPPRLAPSAPYVWCTVSSRATPGSAWFTHSLARRPLCQPRGHSYGGYIMSRGQGIMDKSKEKKAAKKAAELDARAEVRARSQYRSPRP